MRIEELTKIVQRRKLDLALVADQANIRALTGINCDNAILAFRLASPVLYTDFR